MPQSGPNCFKWGQDETQKDLDSAASQAPDKSPSWTGRLPGGLSSWRVCLLERGPHGQVSLPGPRQVSFPDVSACRTNRPPSDTLGQAASWTCQSPGHVILQDRSASPWPGLQDRSPQRALRPLKANSVRLHQVSLHQISLHEVSLQAKTQEKTPVTNRRLTAHLQGDDMIWSTLLCAWICTGPR